MIKNVNKLSNNLLIWNVCEIFTRLCFLQEEDKKRYAYKIHQWAFEYKRLGWELSVVKTLSWKLQLPDVFPFEKWSFDFTFSLKKSLLRK